MAKPVFIREKLRREEKARAEIAALKTIEARKARGAKSVKPEKIIIEPIDPFTRELVQPKPKIKLFVPHKKAPKLHNKSKEYGITENDHYMNELHKELAAKEKQVKAQHFSRKLVPLSDVTAP